MEQSSKDYLKEYSFDAVKKAAFNVFHDPAMNSSTNINDLLEQFDDEMADQVVEELNERPY